MHVIDPNLKSFIPVDQESHFPLQNLPYGVFVPDISEQPRIGVAIGEYVLDLSELEKAGKFDGPKLSGKQVFLKDSLNEFMALGRAAWTEARQRVGSLLHEDNPELRDDTELRDRAFYQLGSVELILPVKVSEFTDFYSSYHHAFNVGSMIRGPENALMDNWKHLPVAYHGRSSSVILSDVAIHRPQGQIKPNDSDTPIFSPTKRLDFELEMGFFVGMGNDLGEPIPINKATDHIFGMVLVNDWSARDIQVWEYRPLGPFLAKNFATSISPWIVTLDALEPFKTKGMEQEPKPMAYLSSSNDMAYDIHLEVFLKSDTMEESTQITWSNAKNLYWNIAQQLAHHTITGCNTRTGDLLASGTISGEDPKARACLLELTELGRKPLKLSSVETRTFLEDGDEVTITGYCDGGSYRVGFGEVRTTILPAKNLEF